MNLNQCMEHMAVTEYSPAQFEERSFIWVILSVCKNEVHLLCRKIHVVYIALHMLRAANALDTRAWDLLLTIQYVKVIILKP